MPRRAVIDRQVGLRSMRRDAPLVHCKEVSEFITVVEPCRPPRLACQAERCKAAFLVNVPQAAACSMVMAVHAVDVAMLDFVLARSAHRLHLRNQAQTASG